MSSPAPDIAYPQGQDERELDLIGRHHQNCGDVLLGPDLVAAVRDVGKKVGGWQNFFYAAPLGAPMAILLTGLLGFCSGRVRESEPGTRPEIVNLLAGRTIGGGRQIARNDR